MDCQANCKALGQVAVDVGVPSKTLCAAVENGKLAYGGCGWPALVQPVHKGRIVA